jgi:hypothetical protein
VDTIAANDSNQTAALNAFSNYTIDLVSTNDSNQTAALLSLSNDTVQKFVVQSNYDATLSNYLVDTIAANDSNQTAALNVFSNYTIDLVNTNDSNQTAALLSLSNDTVQKFVVQSNYDATLSNYLVDTIATNDSNQTAALNAFSNYTIDLINANDSNQTATLNAFSNYTIDLVNANDSNQSVALLSLSNDTVQKFAEQSNYIIGLVSSNDYTQASNLSALSLYTTTELESLSNYTYTISNIEGTVAIDPSWVAGEYLKYDGSNVITEAITNTGGVPVNLIDGSIVSGSTIILGDSSAAGSFGAAYGTSNSPSFTFLDDPYTGIYHGTSNDMSVVVTGKTVTTFTSNALGINVEYPQAELHVDGSVAVTGEITAFYSDERLKDIVSPITNATALLNQISTFTYRPNALAKQVMPHLEDTVHVGVNAQEIQKVMPELVTLAPFDAQKDPNTGTMVSKTGNNYLTVKYDRIVPYLISALNEQQKEIADLKLQIQSIINRM